jgi:hypothetical protein
MNRNAAEGLSENQAAWVGLVRGITLDDLSVKDREVDFIEGEAIGLGLLVGVIADANPIHANRVDNIVNVHDFSPGRKRSVTRSIPAPS